MSRPTRRSAALLLGLGLVVAGCGGDDSTGDGPAAVTLLTHDSFAYTEAVLEAFTAESGIEVEVARGADAGTLVSRAVLTAGKPEGDVLWGVDNTLLSRAVDGEVFEPYRSPGLDALRPELVELVPDDLVTPVDFGDVCVNYDRRWFDDRRLDPPATLDDLRRPEYRDLLVVPNPATSSPGLAFLLATIARYGEDGWQDFWSDLRANGVEIVDGWTQAYTVAFSGSSGEGPRPLVVSYASSPPAEVVFAPEPRPTEAPTAAMTDGCFRQVEFAGVLRGTDHPEEAQALVDFLVSRPFQEDMPLTMFVYPARTDAALPPEFEAFATVPEDPLALPPEEIEANRERWIDEWTTVVLR